MPPRRVRAFHLPDKRPSDLAEVPAVEESFAMVEAVPEVVGRIVVVRPSD